MNGNKTNLSEISEPQKDNSAMFLGSFLGMFSVPGISLNSMIMFTMITQGLLSNTNPVIYKFMFNLMITDTLQMLNIVGYLMPSIIAQNWLLPKMIEWLPGSFVLLNWYLMLLMLSTVAINRLLAICYSSTCKTVFTHKTSILICILSWPLSLTLVIIQKLFPCCEFRVWYVVYSYIYFGEGQNIADLVIDLPGNILTTLVILGSYFRVFFHIRGHNSQVVGNMEELERLQKGRKQELRFALQFFCISIFFIVAWISFRILPAALGKTATKAYASVIVMVVINCSVNGCFYVWYNEDLRRKTAKIFCRACCSFEEFEENSAQANTMPSSDSAVTGEA